MLPLLCTSYFYGKRLISTALLFTYEKRETLYAFICTSTVYFVKNLFFMKDSRNGNFMRSERRSVTFFSTTYFTYIHLSLTIVVSNKVFPVRIWHLFYILFCFLLKNRCYCIYIAIEYHKILQLTFSSD